jgi:hypothetical protein
MNKVQIGDTVYEVDAPYREGAIALRQGVSYNANPYAFGSYAYDQWGAGHCHEDDPETRLDALLSPETQTCRNQEHQKWEYMFDAHHGDHVILNEFGAQGWELVAVQDQFGYFKRRIL